MDAAHLHLAVNHIPVLGVIFATLLFAVGQLWKDDKVRRLGLAAGLASAVMLAPTYLSGDPAENIVEHQPGVVEDLIHPHEEAAETATIVVGVLGVLALLGLVVYRKKSLPAWLNIAFLLLGLAGTGTMAWAAFLGGKIHHQELRGGASAPGDYD